jgi:phosphoribosylamine--glycine ligase
MVINLEHIGILLVSYGSRAAAIIDALLRSRKYLVDLYVVDKQKNPYNFKRAKKHIILPSLDPKEICKFVLKYRTKIDFGIVGPEKPIIAGVRDLVEKETDIPLICPTKDYAIESSKVVQRQLFQEVVPEANPRYQVYYPKEYKNTTDVKKDLFKWLDILNNEAVVKPDSTSAGKGVGVWGDHFFTRKQLFEHFLTNFEDGPVIVEEKLKGEESSFQCFCDGKHLIPLPETRDNKRAFDNDKGPNTGGMGSYKNQKYVLPFMTMSDRKQEIKIVEKIFKKLKGKGSNPNLRGVPLYMAFIFTDKGPMILENNSRPGDPEIINILPLMKDDFVEVCLKMIEGSLTSIDIEEKASVVTYKVPPNYGGYAESFPSRIDSSKVNTPIILEEAENLSLEYGHNIRIYPGSMEIKNNGNMFALKSRTICSVGIEDDIEKARNISLVGLKAIKGGALWNRTDIASRRNIEESIKHMEKLRNHF